MSNHKSQTNGSHQLVTLSINEFWSQIMMASLNLLDGQTYHWLLMTILRVIVFIIILNCTTPWKLAKICKNFPLLCGKKVKLRNKAQENISDFNQKTKQTFWQFSFLTNNKILDCIWILKFNYNFIFYFCLHFFKQMSVLHMSFFQRKWYFVLHNFINIIPL